MRTPLEAPGLVGWIRPGDPSRQVLLLHGGPTLPHTYFEQLLDTIPAWSVASFQQRGRAPSTTQGPFDIPTFVADIENVLARLRDLGWERPLVAGHSWGGHLAWHVAVSLSDRVGGVLALDPMGAVGDMGLPGFGQELMARTPPADVARFNELDELHESPGLTEAQTIEQMALLLPAYFAEPDHAERLAHEHRAAAIAWQFDALMESAQREQARLVAELPRVGVPVAALHGGRSPMPLAASRDAIELVPEGWVDVAENAGHFLWLEDRQAIADALERLYAARRH